MEKSPEVNSKRDILGGNGSQPFNNRIGMEHIFVGV